jgi:Tfp pilus assembly protein PilF/TolB-like protein
LTDVGPDDAAVREALAAVLAWPEIVRSPQLSRFLRYIVERKLDGETQAIKAYSIAVDVFGRPPDFDPQADPIVRVQARRLRSLLDQYYLEDGRDDAVRIDLPIGRYVPEFVWHGSPSDQPRESQVEPDPKPPPEMALAREGISTSWFVLLALTLGAAALAYVFSSMGARQEMFARANDLLEPPVVLVMEFQGLTGIDADSGLTSGLAVELVTDLAQFETIAPVYGGGVASASGLGQAAEFILSGIVRREGGLLQYSAILTDVSSNAVVWNQAIDVEPAEAERNDLLDHVSGQLSRVLGSARGPVHAKARALLLGADPIAGRENLYLCRMLFDLYREAESQPAAQRASSCFAAMPDSDRASGQAIAAAASLDADMARFEPSSISKGGKLTLADERMQIAIEAAPVSAFVWEQRARLFETMGQHQAAEAAYGSALQLNPGSTDALAARARHLAYLGRMDEAVALAQAAVANQLDVPAWYHAVPVIAALRAGDFATAAEQAQLYAEADRELGPVLAVMAGQGLPDPVLISRYLPRVLEVPAFRSQGILTQLRMRILDETLLRDIRVALLSAGVPPASLNEPF